MISNKRSCMKYKEKFIADHGHSPALSRTLLLSAIPAAFLRTAKAGLVPLILEALIHPNHSCLVICPARQGTGQGSSLRPPAGLKKPSNLLREDIGLFLAKGDVKTDGGACSCRGPF